MKRLSAHYSKIATPQSEPVPGREQEQVQNEAGGYVFPLGKWERFRRFLILGTEGGTYYVGERELTVENARNVIACIAEDPSKAVGEIVEISASGRAANNDYALFALALAASAENVWARKLALQALPQVARIPTHLFHFSEYAKHHRGWGRAMRSAVANWYLGKSVGELGYQMAKYQQRDGWSNADLLRKSHPKTSDPAFNAIFKWAVDGPGFDGENYLPSVVKGFEHAKLMTSAEEWADAVSQYGLSWEMLPSEALNSPAVWEALLEKLPMTAMIRNLPKMTAVGLLGPMSDGTRVVVERLNTEGLLKKARVHPIQVLFALATYKEGQGFRGKLEWKPVPQIVDALNGAFYLSFGNVEPIGKRILLAVDASGSMDVPIMNSPLSVREAAVAMAMVTAQTEARYVVTYFTYERNVGVLPVTKGQRLDNAMQELTRRVRAEGTDCALPFSFALNENIPVDAFIILTDNQTWAGAIHPFQLLAYYRKKTGISAKLVVVGMTANNSSIGDPQDASTLDVVGFDTATPNLISDFLRS